jgi:sugar phosphate isomerase/epimerase
VPKPQPVPISLAALTVLEASPVEAVRIAARSGYSHVGLRPVPATPDEPHTPILSHLANQKELRHALAGEGIAVLDCEIVRLTPFVDWGQMELVIEFAAEFGAKRLLVADNDPDPDRSATSLARLAEISLTHGVVPCLEFMPWTCAPNLAAARERIAGIANAALLIDAFHLARSGGSPPEIAQNEAAIGYLQLCDIAGPIPPMDDILREARSDRMFPGEGDIDLVTLLRRLPKVPISLEVPVDRLRDAGWSPEMRATRAIEAARKVIAEADANA